MVACYDIKKFTFCSTDLQSFRNSLMFYGRHLNELSLIDNFNWEMLSYMKNINLRNLKSIKIKLPNSTTAISPGSLDKILIQLPPSMIEIFLSIDEKLPTDLCGPLQECHVSFFIFFHV